jgi:urease beta subunit
MVNNPTFKVHTKQSIVNRLIANGGVDPKQTGSIFHFSLTNDIQTAREDFLRHARWVLGTTPGTC